MLTQGTQAHSLNGSLQLAHSEIELFFSAAFVARDAGGGDERAQGRPLQQFIGLVLPPQVFLEHLEFKIYRASVVIHSSRLAQGIDWSLAALGLSCDRQGFLQGREAVLGSAVSELGWRSGLLCFILEVAVAAIDYAVHNLMRQSYSQ